MVGLATELTQAGADWQHHAYGHAGHAFTDDSTKGSGRPGFGYEERADRRSWQACKDFLAELFVYGGRRPPRQMEGTGGDLAMAIGGCRQQRGLVIPTRGSQRASARCPSRT